MARLKTASSLVQTQAGTMLWMAPEVIEEHPYDGKADVYSYAMVLFELVSKTLPFQGMLLVISNYLMRSLLISVFRQDTSTNYAMCAY